MPQTEEIAQNGSQETIPPTTNTIAPSEGEFAGSAPSSNRLSEAQKSIDSVLRTTSEEKDPLILSENFLREALTKRQITHALTGESTALPVERVQILTGLLGKPDEPVEQTIEFKVLLPRAAELDQESIVEQTLDVLRHIPALSKLKSTSHKWEKDDYICVKFHLPEGVAPAQVVKEILTMTKGAALSAVPDSGLQTQQASDEATTSGTMFANDVNAYAPGEGAVNSPASQPGGDMRTVSANPVVSGVPQPYGVNSGAPDAAQQQPAGAGNTTGFADTVGQTLPPAPKDISPAAVANRTHRDAAVVGV